MKYIMIIDDSPTIRTSVQFAIKDAGYPIMTAVDGQDGLEKIRDMRGKGDDVAMCIVDVNMPQMDGISFIKHLRHDDKFTPILVLTTESLDDKIKEGRESGASGWIVKPFQPPELLHAVQRLVR